MNLPEYYSISRYEKGIRTPSIEILLIYHFLFSASIESLFEQQSEIIHANLIERISPLIAQLKKDEVVQNNISRVKFLEQALIRLTT